MFRRRTWSIVCACGEPLEAMSREGLQGLLRVHVLLDHGALHEQGLDREKDHEVLAG